MPPYRLPRPYVLLTGALHSTSLSTQDFLPHLQAAVRQAMNSRDGLRAVVCMFPRPFIKRERDPCFELLLACGEWIRQEGLPLTVTACLLFRPEAWLKSRLHAAGVRYQCAALSESAYIGELVSRAALLIAAIPFGRLDLTREVRAARGFGVPVHSIYEVTPEKWLKDRDALCVNAYRRTVELVNECLSGDAALCERAEREEYRARLLLQIERLAHLLVNTEKMRSMLTRSMGSESDDS